MNNEQNQNNLERSNYRISILEDKNIQQATDDSLVKYRLTKLEEAVTKLASLSDVIVKWDALFSSQGNPFELAEKRTKSDAVISEHERKISNLITENEVLKKFAYKAIGAFAVISLIIQISVPYFLKKSPDMNDRIVPTIHNDSTK